jgi:hypothetical protein
MENKIQQLIDQAEQWRIIHRNSGRPLEAMAAAIRAIALRDALEIIKHENIHKR